MVDRPVQRETTAQGTWGVRAGVFPDVCSVWHVTFGFGLGPHFLEPFLLEARLPQVPRCSPGGDKAVDRAALLPARLDEVLLRDAADPVEARQFKTRCISGHGLGHSRELLYAG